MARDGPGVSARAQWARETGLILRAAGALLALLAGR